jgi:hypothetical protein
MLFLVAAQALAASEVNFTDIFAGTWDINFSQLNAEGAEEANATYHIVLAGIDEPGKVSGELHGEDEDGADRPLDIWTIANDREESSFSVSTSLADNPDTIEKVASFTFKHGLDGRITAIGSTESFGAYSINVLSPAIIELLLVDPDTKALQIYRLIKNVPPAPRSMKMLLIQMAPLIVMFVFQRFTANQALGGGAGQRQAGAKQKGD